MLNEPTSRMVISTGSKVEIEVFVFGQVDYLSAQLAMSEFTRLRQADDLDQIWLLQHPAIYTQGTACQQQTLVSSQIKTVKSDRGGQITYHGPGQIVMYPLLNLHRFGLGVKSLVANLEQATIELLREYKISAGRRVDAPGVYVDESKIAALGLRIRRGNSYHGLSLNVDMDLQPFLNIDPCGIRGLAVTQMANYLDHPNADDIGQKLLQHFVMHI